MKKNFFVLSILCSSTLLFSCDNESGSVLNPEAEMASSVEELTASYEMSLDKSDDCSLKGYVAEKVKDETTPTKDEETVSSADIIKALKEELEKGREFAYSKTTRDVPGFVSYQVGVFKISSCGNQQEFIYHMDCEDGGWTSISNPRNRPFATFVDGNGNVEFHMCVVGGASYGGFALALSPIHESFMGNLIVVERYHDNEDSNNKNQILSTYKPQFRAPTVLGSNSLFSWVNDLSGQGYWFSFGEFGVISQYGDVILSIDDENKKNKNWAHYNERSTVLNWKDFPYRQDKWGMNLWENTEYKIEVRK